MAFNTDYSSFGASISTWLDVSDLDSSLIADIITVGEQRIFREVRARDMEAPISDTIASGVVAVPNDYLAMKFLYLNASPQVALERRSAEWIYANWPQSTTSGIPQFFARNESNFIFGPYPDSGYAILGVYYARPTAISAAGLNTLFTNNPDLYLFSCLSKSSTVVTADKRTPIWEAEYQRILAELNGMDRAEDQSGSTLRMRTSTNDNYARIR